jgi:hypothetical protein
MINLAFSEEVFRVNNRLLVLLFALGSLLAFEFPTWFAGWKSVPNSPSVPTIQTNDNSVGETCGSNCPDSAHCHHKP